MKKIIILLLCLALVSCGTTNKSKSITKDTSENSSSRVKVKDKLIYKKDKSINSFLNKYNKINNPDITSDMVSMKKLKGKDKPDIVNISNDKLEIYIYIW